MSLNILLVKSSLRRAFSELGHQASVKLHPEGTEFSIQVTEGHRGSQELTDGMTQETHRIRFLSDDWDAASPGRPPQRGDRFEIMGTKYRVQLRQRARGLANENIMYVLELRG